MQFPVASLKGGLPQKAQIFCVKVDILLVFLFSTVLRTNELFRVQHQRVDKLLVFDVRTMSFQQKACCFVRMGRWKRWTSVDCLMPCFADSANLSKWFFAENLKSKILLSFQLSARHSNSSRRVSISARSRRKSILDHEWKNYGRIYAGRTTETKFSPKTPTDSLFWEIRREFIFSLTQRWKPECIGNNEQPPSSIILNNNNNNNKRRTNQKRAIRYAPFL